MNSTDPTMTLLLLTVQIITKDKSFANRGVIQIINRKLYKVKCNDCNLLTDQTKQYLTKKMSVVPCIERM